MNQPLFHYIFATLFLNTSMTVLAHYYFQLFSHESLPKRRLFFGIPCLAVINLAWFMPSRQIFFYSFTTMLYLAYAVYARTVFRFRWQESILYTMLYYFLTHFIVRFFSWLSVQLLGYNFMEYGSPFLAALTGDLAIILLSSLAVFVFREKLRLLADYHLSVREFLNIILLGIPLIFLCHSQYLMKVDYLHFPLEIVLMRSVVSLCAVYALVGIISTNKSRTEQIELQKIQSLLESQYEQFKLKKESSELIMTKCHDLQKQLRLFQATNQPEYIENYQKELQQTIQDFDSLYETGNATIDTLLSDASLKCRSDQVKLICLLDGHCFEFIAPIDLCTIFGNALDNAIESVRQITDPEKRIIHVKATEEKGYLLLRFDNYYEHTLNWQNGELQTSKAEKESHGYGLKSIGFAVKKYNGQMVSDARDGRFVLTVTFPLE